MVSPRHQLKRKQTNVFNDYSQKLIDDFKLIVGNTQPELTDKKRRSIATSFGSLVRRIAPLAVRVGVKKCCY